MIENKVIMITGAAQGIGKSTALRFAAQGAKVALLDKSPLESVLAGSDVAENQTLCAQVDITDFASCKAAAEACIKRFGRIDALVNYAAMYATLSMAPFDAIPEAEWDSCMRVNITGTWNMCRAVAPAMREQNSGSIINVASNTALIGQPMVAHYATSKMALLGMTRTLARELGEQMVRVNVIAPTVTATEGTDEISKGMTDQFVAMAQQAQSVKRPSEIGDITNLVEFLASDKSSFITGQTLLVEGGQTFS